MFPHLYLLEFMLTIYQPRSNRGESLEIFFYHNLTFSPPPFI
jgi:hypothetical protein